MRVFSESLTSLLLCGLSFTCLNSLGHLLPRLDDLGTLVVLKVADAVVAHLLPVGAQHDKHGNFHDSVLLLERLFAGLIVVLDRLPWHLREVPVEVGLVPVLADKYNFEVLIVGIDLVVLFRERGRESTAAWGPVSTKVEADAFDSSGEGLSERLHALRSKELGSDNILHILY